MLCYMCVPMSCALRRCICCVCMQSLQTGVALALWPAEFLLVGDMLMAPLQATSVMQQAVCLHADAYAKLAHQMALPQTASLALAGPLGPIPGTTCGRAWYNEDDEAQAYSQVYCSNSRFVCGDVSLLKAVAAVAQWAGAQALECSAGTVKCAASLHMCCITEKCRYACVSVCCQAANSFRHVRSTASVCCISLLHQIPTAPHS